MASVASQLIEEVTAHVQSYSLEDARELCADGIYFPNNLRIYIPLIYIYIYIYIYNKRLQANIIRTHSYTSSTSISIPYHTLPEREMNPQSLVAVKAKSG